MYMKEIEQHSACAPPPTDTLRVKHQAHPQIMCSFTKGPDIHRLLLLLVASAAVLHLNQKCIPYQPTFFTEEVINATIIEPRESKLDDLTILSNIEDVFRVDINVTELMTILVNATKPPKEETWPRTSQKQHAYSPSEQQRIPRVINKMYFQKDGRFRAINPANNGSISEINLKKAHESWTAMNPGYNIRYFNLVTARKYLANHFHPAFLRTFDCLQSFAFKSDFFRMAILYKDGGFHSDWKQECLERELLDRIANMTDFWAVLDIGNRWVEKVSVLDRICLFRVGECN